MSELHTDSPVTALPERARLLHIGLPKTGTTALQAAASRSRPLLLDHGVRYPGKNYNHRFESSGLLGRRFGSSELGGGKEPRREQWDEMMAEIEADTSRRIFVSHEMISEANDERAKLYATEFGDRTHVVITLRGLGAMLPSIWQQFIKSGMRADFDWWLTHVLDNPPRTQMTPSFYLRNDQAGVVRRWASEVGADNVTVVILDKNQPNLLFDAFEGMLGLPPGLLRNVETGEFRQNRSLSAEEAFLVMEFNRRAHESGMTWLEYQRLLRRGAVERILELSNAAESGTKLILPEWAAERARELGRSYAASIADSGVRVLGDLAELSAEVPTRGDEFLRVPVIPADTAAEALAGMASAALWRGSNFGEAKVPLSEVEKTVARQSERLDSADPGVRRKAVARQAKDITTADLSRLLLSRLKRKVGLK